MTNADMWVSPVTLARPITAQLRSLDLTCSWSCLTWCIVKVLLLVAESDVSKGSCSEFSYSTTDLIWYCRPAFLG